MLRHTEALKIKEGEKDSFRAALGNVWPELTAFLDEKKVKNFSVWNAEDLVFFYGETDDCDENAETEAEGCGKAELNAKNGQEDSAVNELLQILAPLEEHAAWLSAPGQGMRLMYQNYGIVRECKEMIRHRMFMTKLKDGCAEEYKRRHDALVAARGESIDPGPDSNFTIWSDGQYIFGYDEIDTTMEKEPTEEDLKSTLAWETRQLEIMDWITNDCDSLFGTHHAASVCLGYHN